MNTMKFSQRIDVSSRRSASGRAWIVSVDDECRAIHTGDRAKARAMEHAFRLAEDLRMQGAVLVVVEPDDDKTNVSRVVRSRLAS
jgi:hypothetical protein